MKILVGQGNPGNSYNQSRHNAGFMVVESLSIKLKTKFNLDTTFNSQIARLEYQNQLVLLVKPLCYYNMTGAIIHKLINYYKLIPDYDLLVIHDELALPFGKIRTRSSGRDAGNNAIKNINHHIGQKYHRMRIGVAGDKTESMSSEEFVLSNFSKIELRSLEESIIPHAVELALDFISNKLKISSKKLL